MSTTTNRANIAMKKQIPPRHDDPAEEFGARLVSIPIGAADAFWLPMSALRRMWSTGVLKATLTVLAAALVAAVLSAVISKVSNGIVAQLVQATLMMTAMWVGLTPLLRATARDEDCGWHLDEDEQAPIASALKRIALTASLWQLATVVILYAVGIAAGFLVALTSPWMLLLFVPLLLTLGPMLLLMSAAALTRNAIEARPSLSSLRESFTGVQALNAFKASSLGSVIPTLLLLALVAMAWLSKGKALMAMLAFGPLLILGMLAQHPVAGVLLLIAGTVSIYMFTIACLLEYLDRIHERDAGSLETGDSGLAPDAGPQAAGESVAAAHPTAVAPVGSAPPTATDPSATSAAVAQSAPPSRFRPLVLAAGIAPAAAAAAAWKAHRELRKADEDMAREVMLANGRAHIEAIVANRTADEALLVFNDCLKADPGFEAGAAARIGLARFAIGDAQPQLALKMVSGFDKRFDNHPLIPAAYAIAHEALTATGKADLATRVLAAMRHHYPEHPMTKRLEGLAANIG